MKKKIRDIIVSGKEYSYVLNRRYTKKSCNISIKISQKENKKHTCTFFINTIDDPITGSPLLVGVALRNDETNQVEKYNLHHPKVIREFIMYGTEHGWTGENIMEFRDGLDVISKKGLDIEWLRPKIN
jgi:hypothetical protein